MKRITLICLASERDRTLEVLRDVGVVHVTDIQEPFGSDLDEVRARLSTARRALEEVERASEHRREARKAWRGRRRAGAVEPVDDAPGRMLVKEAEGESAAELVTRVDELIVRRRDLRDEVEAGRRELARVAGFGELDPAVLLDLAEHGVHVRLAMAPPEARLSSPESFVVERLGADSNGIYVAVVGRQPFEIDELDLGAPVVEVRAPQESPSRLRARIDAAAAEADRIDDELADLSALRARLEEYVVTLEDTERFAAVRLGMGVAQPVAFLQGYVPAEAVVQLRRLAEEHGWGLQSADPLPGESVPTMLRYSRIVAPIRAVLDFLKIYPGYWEADIGWTFLIFFSIFFAMLAGDAGYGLLLLIAAIVVRVRAKRVPRYAVQLLFIVGTTTLLWGILTGNYFGIRPLPAFMAAFRVDWLADRDNVIQLCFLIGAIHLTIAHVWNIIALVRSGVRGKALAQLGYLLVVWSMFFLARQTVLGLGMPSFVPYMLAVGFLLVAAFMATPQEFRQSFIGHALLPLNMISNFVDILSYIRLFAVGYASLAVITAFNDMASSIGFDHPVKAFGAVLLIVFANVLNLALIGLGVLVHAVRLNTLEFSTHKGLTWAGYTYKPFASRSSGTP